jgi:hypothetical protein
MDGAPRAVLVRVMRTGNGSGKKQIQGFFAALRMTTLYGLMAKLFAIAESFM